jgi:hypothetical protein
MPEILAAQESEIQGNRGSKPGQANNSQDPYLKRIGLEAWAVSGPFF